RVRKDPASIAFGALAEEYRRAGRLDEAVAACRAGLERHPAYLSARVTLGRALQQLERVDEARTEFEYVLSIAPDNLAAIRALAELGDPAAPPALIAPVPAVVGTVPEVVEPAPAEPPAFSERAGDPDFSALDASIEAAAGSQRAAQIERLEIWLARIEELRRGGETGRDA
ncbi:MAG: tetratricopeptide repeat protein, partial [Vicinamibacterales bacterium]